MAPQRLIKRHFQDDARSSRFWGRIRLARPILALTAITLVLSVFPPTSTIHASYQPQFDSASCPFKVNPTLTEGKDVRCGYLIVPEDRTHPDGGTVRLAVAIFRSQAVHPAPEPVINLAGGPGALQLQTLGAAISIENAPDQIGNRDLILIDQRGVGYSRPSLDCPELQKVFVQKGATPGARLASQINFTVNGTKQCRNRLTRQGVDLAAFTTPENAADIADLRLALGIDQVNLYGGSYGSRLALAVMRDHPEGIRSVVIDAVAHPGFNQFTDAIPNFWRALHLIFTQCAASPTCNSVNPDLGKTFSSVVTRLNEKPLKLLGTRVDGLTLTLGLLDALYHDSVIPQVPQVLTQVHRGDYRVLTQLASQLSAYSSPGSFGMYLGMECSDDLAGAEAASMGARAKVLPGAVRSLMTKSTYTSYLMECRAWGAKPVADSYHQPVTSAIPTLILSSEFDPRTPPANGKAASRSLTHSYYFVFPGLGHGARFHHACPDSMVWNFFDQPSRAPSAVCMASMPDPFK